MNQATSGLSADFYQLDSHRWENFNPVALYSETINGVDTLFVLDAYHSQVFTYDLATGKRPADGGGGFRIDKVETSGHQRFSGVTLTADEDYFYVSHIQKSESNTITNLVRYLEAFALSKKCMHIKFLERVKTFLPQKSPQNTPKKP